MPKPLLLALLGAFSSLACQTPLANSHKPDPAAVITITHFNIIFAPDLSNRVNPAICKRPLTDARILSTVTQSLYPSILKHRRAENQLDKFRVDFINRGLITQYRVNADKLMIDFGKFSNQNERISYILARNGAQQTLRSDTSYIAQEFERVQQLAANHPAGADIWNYFNQVIDDKKVLPSEKPVSDGTHTYVNTYRNVLILTTDGYIEAGIFQQNVDLSQNNIKRFRNAFLASGENDIAAFYRKNKQFQIRPVNNDNLKNLEVLVMELYDRSLAPSGEARVHPTDMEIIKLFWTDWLQQSKVKRFELRPYAGSVTDARKIILDFLGV